MTSEKELFPKQCYGVYQYLDNPSKATVSGLIDSLIRDLVKQGRVKILEEHWR
jgi:hypothetical protein